MRKADFGRDTGCPDRPGARLAVACDSCRTITELDLSMKPGDPDAPIRVALDDLRCPEGRLGIVEGIGHAVGSGRATAFEIADTFCCDSVFG
jgi:hypothetical protein